MKANEEQLSPEQKIARTIKRRTFISFSVFGVAATVAGGLWGWFRSLPKTDNKLSAPSRRMLQFNEQVNGFFFSDTHLAPTYNVSEAVTKPRVNGYFGLNKGFDASAWTLQTERPGGIIIPVSIQELKSLPKTEIVYNFKCIEGWSQVVHFGGVKFSDFLQHYNLGTKSGNEIVKDKTDDWYQYVGLETPDKKYYVGIDMKSMLHPQTLLCYELNGSELPAAHGAPLRLIIPVKYGVKHLKRIGRIFFSDTRPRDYWHERGYDYDLAL